MRYITKIYTILLVSLLITSPVYAYTTGAITSTVRIDGTTVNGPGALVAQDQYAVEMANIGDLDGDGVNDMLIGANGDDTGISNGGAAYIHFMNTNGSIKSTVKITTLTTNGPTLAVQDIYGNGVAGIGDLDGDGVPDIAVSASRDDTGGVAGTDRGAVYIHYMNRDGSIKSTVKLTVLTPNGATGLAVNDRYGNRIDGLGDLDNDGIPDLVASANRDDTGGTDRGAIYIHYMNRNGSIKSTVKIASGTLNGPTLADNDQYGFDVKNIGDLDGDGIQDIGVGTFSDDTGGTDRGAAYIHYMNRDGSIKSTVKLTGNTPNGATLANSDNYGNRIVNLGDLNGDGVPDLAIGASGDDTGGTNRGAWYIHYMNRDGSIISTVKIASGTTHGPTLADSDNYGNAIANMGDLNNDGATDVAVSSLADTGFKGAWYIHFMTPTPGVTVSKTSLSTSENGTTDSFTMKLLSKPTSDVTVTLSLSTNQALLSTNTLTFTSVNWNTPQIITVSAVNDSVVESSQSDNVSFVLTSVDSSYNGYSVSSIPVTIADNDTAQSSGGGGVVYCTDTLTTFCRQRVSTTTSTVNVSQPQMKEPLFTKVLRLGSRDEQVRLLQKFLNKNGYTVSTKGAGSLGNESTYFNKLTKNALIRFQKANSLEYKSGIFGKQSMGFVNKLIAN